MGPCPGRPGAVGTMAPMEPHGAPDEGGLDIDLGAPESIEAELERVEAAMRRLDDGTYGRCDVCGEPLSDGELAEDPEALFCRAHLPISLD
jgi:RNA polymerase-binding transcription factor DksA